MTNLKIENAISFYFLLRKKREINKNSKNDSLENQNEYFIVFYKTQPDPYSFFFTMFMNASYYCPHQTHRNIAFDQK